MKNVDFGSGPVWKCILAQGIPLTIAQFVQLLYNMVDRIYLGHLDSGDSLALTGVGLTFPVVTLILAFAALFGIGGIPLFAIERGRGDTEKAGKILGTSFTLLLLCAAAVTVFGYLFMRPVLFAFGASEDSFVYAGAYLRIYLAGTVFFMISAGMNGYINAQGFPRIGMLSTVIGALLNIALDPVFIFLLRLGVRGAAIATVISQMASAVWVLRFLLGRNALVPLTKAHMGIEKTIAKDILKLGTASFIMQGTNSAVQIACNSTLQIFGGDLYVGVMTVANSVREIFMLPLSGIVSGAQPVMSYNYGARQYDRVRSAIQFNTFSGALYMVAAWLLVIVFPRFWFRVFSDDPRVMEAGSGMLKIYFFGFMFMALQFAGQAAFQAVGDARHAITFSLLRKIVIVVPLTLLLPRLGFGVTGVFLAEPVSNVIGGAACYTTMRLTLYRKLIKGG